MTSLTKNIPIASFNLRSILPLLLVIACIVALFFVPDFFRPSRERSVPNEVETSPRAVEAPARRVAPRVERVEPSEDKIVTPLDEILEEVTREDENPFAVRRAGRAASEPLGEQPLTWDALRSDRAQAALSTARSTAQTLIGDIKADKSEARQALFLFIGTVDLILGEGNKLITAKEAADQLEAADLSVAGALQEDGIDRAKYLSWMEVSIAPAVQSYRTERLKYQLLHPFDPQLRLVQVTAAKIEPPPGSRQRTKYRIDILGSVRGDDISKIRLFRNGIFIQDVPFGQPDESGYRHFSFARENGLGVWTFRINDTADGLYQKSYRFFPTIERFPREGYSYVLPFDTSQPDPRLDAIFAVSEIKGPDPREAASGFVNF